jgi:hypothetical protein
MRVMIFAEVHTPDNGWLISDPSVVHRTRRDESSCGEPSAQAAEVVEELVLFDDEPDSEEVADFSVPDDFSVPGDFSEFVVAVAAAVLPLVRLSVA